MARVLICEPHDDVCALLQLIVRRLGHEPVEWGGGQVDTSDVAAALIEPGDPAGMRLAIRLHDEGTPILFTSIFPPDDAALALQPAAYLVKPFPLYRLEEALAGVLAAGAPHVAAC